MPDLQQWKVTEPYVNPRCHLGEGPHYVPELNQLRFVDVYGCKIYFVDLDQGPRSLRSVDAGTQVGVTADIEGLDPSRTILVGIKDGVAKFDIQTGKLDYITKFWTGSDAEDNTRRMRSNDGNVDSAGRFWIEAFVDPEIEEPTDEGVVFRMSHSGELERMHDAIKIPNGISWTLDDKTIYITDTTAQKIWSYNYDSQSGRISDKKIFVDLEKVGNPDGHAMDVEGNIWQALYGGSKVIRISPTGEITGEILLPTRNPTCPVFAGTELFITSAKEESPEQNPGSAKTAGAVFRVDVGVKGKPKQRAQIAT